MDETKKWIQDFNKTHGTLTSFWTSGLLLVVFKKIKAAINTNVKLAEPKTQFLYHYT